MATKVDLDLDVKEVFITGSGNEIRVKLEDAVIVEVLDHFTIEDILRHFDKAEIMDEIGEDKFKEHFGIE